MVAFDPLLRLLRRRLTAYLVILAAAFGAIVAVTVPMLQFAALRFDAFLRADQEAALQKASSRRQSTVSFSQDEWHERLKSQNYWSGRITPGSGPSAPAIQRSSLFDPLLNPLFLPRGDGEGDKNNRGTYRTVCVRLCDGYFFPISFATTKDNFRRDRGVCERSCGGGGARLFVYRNPGQEPEDMRDVDGEPYSKLKTAFLYRTTYVPSCKCQPDPWEQVSMDRHRLYALEAARAKGDREAGKKAIALKAEMAASRRREAQKPAAPMQKSTTAVATLPAEPAKEMAKVPAVEPQPAPPAAVSVSPVESIDSGADGRKSGAQTAEQRAGRPPTIMRLGAQPKQDRAAPPPPRAAAPGGGAPAWRSQAFRSD